MDNCVAIKRDPLIVIDMRDDSMTQPSIGADNGEEREKAFDIDSGSNIGGSGVGGGGGFSSFVSNAFYGNEKFSPVGENVKSKSNNSIHRKYIFYCWCRYS